MYVGSVVATKLADEENEVEKVVAVYKDGTVMPPCWACRELMMQLGKKAKDIEILINNDGKTINLDQLISEYPY